MAPQHVSLSAGRWQSFSLMEQLANIGSEVARAGRRQGTDPAAAERACVRALELLDLTIQDERWRGRRNELTRVRECLCDARQGGTDYGTTFEALDRYFLPFAIAANAARESRMKR
ncbi:MAG TPA: hypothetical protein VJ692_10355 [Nitrospiraceae bacterium]|nr:hypothetical protein [Nitrospiraceae bacterium]